MTTRARSAWRTACSPRPHSLTVAPMSPGHARPSVTERLDDDAVRSRPCCTCSTNTPPSLTVDDLLREIAGPARDSPRKTRSIGPSATSEHGGLLQRDGPFAIPTRPAVQPLPVARLRLRVRTPWNPPAVSAAPGSHAASCRSASNGRASQTPASGGPPCRRIAAASNDPSPGRRSPLSGIILTLTCNIWRAGDAAAGAAGTFRPCGAISADRSVRRVRRDVAWLRR